MVTLQSPVPEQAPDHPKKSELASGMAWSVTAVPAARGAEKTPPGQLNPSGLDVTRPAPSPVAAALRRYHCWHRFCVHTASPVQSEVCPQREASGGLPQANSEADKAANANPTERVILPPAGFETCLSGGVGLRRM